MHLLKDDGTSSYIEFLNQEHWCQNQFQVTQQVTMEGTYKNRYDVTLLINGLPLVQIELKRRGLELKEAFKQINRYQRHSYGASNALFNYIQILSSATESTRNTLPTIRVKVLNRLFIGLIVTIKKSPTFLNLPMNF